METVEETEEQEDDELGSGIQHNLNFEKNKEKIKKLTSEMSDDEKSKINIDLASLTEKTFKAAQSLKQEQKRDPKLKKFLTLFDDSNTKLMMDTDLDQDNDKQMSRL